MNHAYRLRPIDICDLCDGLFELVALTPDVRSLRFVKRWKDGRVRLHPECVERWEMSEKPLDIQAGKAHTEGTTCPRDCLTLPLAQGR